MTDRPHITGNRPAFAALILAVLLLTLAPLGDRSEVVGVLCVVCGADGGADFILNLLLFVPLGFLAIRSFPGSRPAVAGILLLPVAIELAQLAIPGRYPTFGDVIANGLGAGLGIGSAIVGRNARLRKAGTRLALVPVLIAALLLPVTLLLLEPAFPDTTYYGQWTADLGYLAAYPGIVHEARIGSSALPGRRLDGPSVAAFRSLASDGRLRVGFTTGPGMAELAPVFSVYDDRQAELFLLGVRGDALVVRVRRRARDFRLRSPAVSFAGAHPSPGTRTEVRVWRSAGAVCLATIGEGRRCGELGTPARGWSLLLGDAPLAPGWLDAAWMALLGLFAATAGRACGSRRTGGLAVLGLAGMYAVLWAVAGGGLGWLPGLLGLSLGFWVGWRT